MEGCWNEGKEGVGREEQNKNALQKNVIHRGQSWQNACFRFAIVITKSTTNIIMEDTHPHTFVFVSNTETEANKQFTQSIFYSFPPSSPK